MFFLKKIIQFFNKPFPQEYSWIGVSKNVLSISAFMTLFLYLFQPSGISEAEGNKFLICLGFGIASALSYFIFEFIFSLLFRQKTIDWTYGKWLLYSLGVLFFISLGNFLYARMMIFGYMDWRLFPAMISGVFMFGIPVITLLVIMSLQQEKKYQQIAQAINQQPQTITLPKTTNHSIFNIPVHQIKYIEALQNYVTIGFIDINQQFKTKTERATLKNILKETQNSSIVRTHRSFLVNQKAIVSTSGNSQGLLLTLSDCNKQIPVSRSYVSTFKKG